MAIQNLYSNSGVQGATGYEFQKKCVLYIILEEYDSIKDREYFISMESADDFVICFLNNSDLNEVQSYQAKKKDSKNWTLNEIKNDSIILKMCESGIMISSDTSYQHSADYSQKLTFLTNQAINFKSKVCNESSMVVTYNSLEGKQKESIKENLSKKYKEKKHKESKSVLPISEWYNNNKISVDSEINRLKEELVNLQFRFVDLSKTDKGQREALIGKIANFFGSKIADPSAAYESLISLLTKSSTTYNQNNIISLGDINKQVTSDEINNCFNIITSKAKFYDRWEKSTDEICKNLKLSIRERKNFKLMIENSFDLLKDKKQIAHQNILNKGLELFKTSTCETTLEFANEIFQTCKETEFLDELNLKAICFAVAIVIINE